MNASIVTVREARDEEHERCRRMLPECFFPGAAPELFVAADDNNNLQAAAAVLWSVGGFPVQLNVLEPFRRRGVGRALIEAITTAACDETAMLRSWFPIAEHGAGAKFLMRMGFAVERRLLGFETDSLKLADEANRFYRRLEHRLPRDARIVTLKEAPIEEVAQLVAREFGRAPAFVAAQLETGAVYDPDNCVVAMHGEKVVGAMLAVREGDCLRVDVNVVAPDYRQGWTSVLLLVCMEQRAIAAGALRFRFFCDDTVRDTLNLARRVNARALEPALLFVKAMA